MSVEIGDLVVVVKPCPFCGNSKALGYTFVVASFTDSDGPYRCCGKGEGHNEYCASDGREDRLYAVHRLKKVPPLSELEDSQREEMAVA